MRTPLPSPPAEGQVAGPGLGATGRDSGAVRASRAVAFVSDFRYVDVAFDELLPVLLDPRAGWLQKVAGAATAGSAAGSPLQAIVHVRIGSHKPPVPVLVRVGNARRRPDGVVVPLGWTPLEDPVIPDLDGDLDLSPVDTDSCRLGLSGRSRLPVTPQPADGTGRRIEPHAVHDVAETAVRDFLRRVQLALLESTHAAAHR
jgi:hypothetical protein